MNIRFGWKTNGGVLEPTLSMPISRADLQAVPAKRRLNGIRCQIEENIQPQVLRAAELGTTSYFHWIPKPRAAVSATPRPYEVTPEDLAEGLRIAFPGCSIRFSEESRDGQNGTLETRSGILIDWS